MQPYLVPTEPLRKLALEKAAREFEREQGVGRIPSRSRTSATRRVSANAYAVGFGPSRKVVIWSTMIDGSFSNAEVRVVLAHEIGHHSSRHIPKALAWFVLFALPSAYVLMRATRRRGGMGEAAAVPLALLVVAVIRVGAGARAGPDQPADGGRSRLEGTSDDAMTRPPRGSCSSTSGGRTSRIPIRRSARMSSSTAIPRSCSALPWPRPGRRDTSMRPRSTCPRLDPPSGGVSRPAIRKRAEPIHRTVIPRLGPVVGRVLLPSPDEVLRDQGVGRHRERTPEGDVSKAP